MSAAPVEPLPDDSPAPEREGGLYRFSAAHFLAALVLLLVTLPFVQEWEHGQPVEAALVTVVLLSAVPAVGGQRRTLVEGVILVTPAIVATWWHHLHPHVMPQWAALTAALLFVAFVVYHLVRFILTSPHVDSQVLCAGISTYLMMGIFWAFAHSLIEQLHPNAYLFASTPRPAGGLAGFEAMYFSFSTLTTVAYGDIMPVANVARMASMAEATAGLFYVTMMIARLVALSCASTTSKENAP